MTGAPAVLPGAWTFWADRAVSPHAAYGQVQVTGFSYSSELSGFGSGEATILIEGNALTRMDLLGFYSWRLWAFYDGVPVWGGLPTGLHDDGSSAVKVSLTELPGYLLRKAYATAQTYTGAEQTQIAKDIAQRLDNIGVAIVTDPGPGKTRDRTYVFLEGDSRGAMLTALAEVSNGPEFRAEYAIDTSGLPTCTLKIAYPRVGVAGAASGLALPVPGGAISFQLEWSAEQMRTRTFAVGDVPDGAASSALKPVIQVTAPQAGVPTVDGADDHPHVVLMSTLQEKADTAAQIYAKPAVTLTAVMPVTAPPLGTYGLGDDVAVTLADPLMPAGFNATGELTKIDVDAAAGTASWEVSITLPKPRKRTLHHRILHNEVHIKHHHRHNLQTPSGITEP